MMKATEARAKRNAFGLANMADERRETTLGA
jgi:hypothetical protein